MVPAVSTFLLFLGLLTLGSSLPFVEEIHGHGHGHAVGLHSSHIHTHTHAHGVECSEVHLTTGGVAGHAHPPPPPGPPLCSCTTHCDEKLKSFTDLVVRNRATQIVCSETYTTLCCNEFDPWPGITDTFAHLAPCVPETQCRRAYGAAATDVRDFGVIGPCPGGFGVVRCLDGIAPVIPVVPVPEPTGPIHIVIPIVENPQPQPPPPPQTPAPVPPKPADPVPVPETPTPVTVTETTVIPTQPPAPVTPVQPGYDLPPPPPPQTVPEPSLTYLPPKPVAVPVPEPSGSYLPPSPVPVPEPVLEPTGGYLPPKPEPVPVSTSYGVPLAEPLGELEHFYGYTSRFGYPYAYPRYPAYSAYSGLGAGGGFHFRLNKHKSFGLFG